MEYHYLTALEIESRTEDTPHLRLAKQNDRNNRTLKGIESTLEI